MLSRLTALFIGSDQQNLLPMVTTSCVACVHFAVVLCSCARYCSQMAMMFWLHAVPHHQNWTHCQSQSYKVGLHHMHMQVTPSKYQHAAIAYMLGHDH